MRNRLSYEIQLFWIDKTPVENTLGTFAQNQMIDFVAQKAIEQINKLPKEIRQDLIDKLISK